jgi:hypothetical protein
VQDVSVGYLFDYWFAEGLWGMRQEQLLYLGKGNDRGMKKLTERMVDGWEDVGKLWEARNGVGEGEGEDKLVVVIY